MIGIIITTIISPMILFKAYYQGKEIRKMQKYIIELEEKLGRR